MFYQFIKHDFGPDRTRHRAKSCFIKLLNKVVKVAKVVNVVKVVFYNLPPDSLPELLPEGQNPKPEMMGYDL